MNTRRAMLVATGGMVLVVVATWIAGPVWKGAMRGIGPARVTLWNVTGEDITEVTISLGMDERVIPRLEDGRFITVAIAGRFGECSTHVGWRDSAGRHEGSAGDYMESCGSSHSTVVLTPEKRVRAVHQITAMERAHEQ